jgi:hypothetical protein
MKLVGIELRRRAGGADEDKFLAGFCVWGEIEGVAGFLDAVELLDEFRRVAVEGALTGDGDVANAVGEDEGGPVAALVVGGFVTT